MVVTIMKLTGISIMNDTIFPFPQLIKLNKEFDEFPTNETSKTIITSSQFEATKLGDIKSVEVSNISSRDQLINFLKITKLDQTYKFNLPMSADESRQYVHRMRVELSRLRDAVKTRGHQIKHFKVIIQGLEQISITPPVTQVKLLRTLSQGNALVNDLSEIFSEISISNSED